MWQKLGSEPGGLNVADPDNDDAVRGRSRILRAVHSCLVQGMQASSKWLLAASAASCSGSHDRGIAET